MKSYIKKGLLALGLVLAFPIGLALAGGNELAYFKMQQLDTLLSTAVVSGDFVSVYDATAGKVVKVDAMSMRQFGTADAVETVITTNVIAGTECGKTFFLGLADGFTSTLPAPTAGCAFKFIVSVSPTTAYILASNAGADVIHISVNELETDTAEDGVYDDDADAVDFVANVSVTGDQLDCISDGTGWYCNGQSNADGAFTASTT